MTLNSLKKTEVKYPADQWGEKNGSLLKMLLQGHMMVPTGVEPGSRVDGLPHAL